MKLMKAISIFCGAVLCFAPIVGVAASVCPDLLVANGCVRSCCSAASEPVSSSCCPDEPKEDDSECSVSAGESSCGVTLSIDSALPERASSKADGMISAAVGALHAFAPDPSSSLLPAVSGSPSATARLYLRHRNLLI